ncbi:hypothetical protein [Nodularia sp. UHCC 0506]|nr:hypothetical protein [Nodularia sp. UHCC 0506]MEA5513346.1 hypothetical protein [Nodularia sp. UHCC 0506]
MKSAIAVGSGREQGAGSRGKETYSTLSPLSTQHSALSTFPTQHSALT